MKRFLCIHLLGGVLICGLPFEFATAKPPELRSVANFGCAQWTAARRQADPEGFFGVVMARLRCEAKQNAEALASLRRDIDRQNLAIDAKVEEWQEAEFVSATFRDAYHQAMENGQWPVSVRGECYPEGQLASQVSLLMKEAEALADSVAKMRRVRDKAEAQFEQLKARAHVIDSQISICKTKFELWKASRLESHGEELLAQFDALIAEVPELQFEDVVYGPDGFAVIPRDTVQSHRNREALVQYLSAPRNREQQIQTSVEPIEQKCKRPGSRK
jgi:hypothetical protein